MSNTLTTLLLREKRRQLLLTLAGAVFVAALVLSISYGLLSLDNQGTRDGDNDPPDDSDSYSLSLSAQLSSDFVNDNIAAFQISGNITPSIHPRLIFSELVPHSSDEGLWDGNAFVLNKTTMDPATPHELEFTFTDSQMMIIHQSFTDALKLTTEVEDPGYPEDPQGSIPYALFYSVYFTNGSALEFLWTGFANLNIMEVSHFNWDPTSGSYNQVGGFEDRVTHYVTPLSAFDSFIVEMQQLYATILD